MDIHFTPYCYFGSLFKVRTEQALDRTLWHAAISNQILVNLTLHYPFTKPDKLIILLYNGVLIGKTVKTGSASIALLPFTKSPLLYLIALASRTIMPFFSSNKKKTLEQLPMSFPQLLCGLISYTFLPTDFDHIVWKNILQKTGQLPSLSSHSLPHSHCALLCPICGAMGNLSNQSINW